MKLALFLAIVFMFTSCGMFTPVATTVNPVITTLVDKYTPGGTTLYVDEWSIMGADTLSVLPSFSEFIEYSVSCPENNVTTIRLTSTGRILGYRSDGNGIHIAFDIEASPSPWFRDNEKVYDTFFGPVRIGIHPTLFLPYQGRISLGTQTVWNVTRWQRW